MTYSVLKVMLGVVSSVNETSEDDAVAESSEQFQDMLFFHWLLR